MLKPILILLNALVLLFAATAVNAQSGPSKIFKDWEVGCSIGLVCTMYSNVEAGDIFALRRGTSANAALDLLMGLDYTRAENSKFKLVVTGQGGVNLVELDIPVNTGKWEEYFWAFPLDKYQDKLLPALIAGNKLLLQGIKGEKKVSLEISLSGVIASLLYVDESQGREGRRDALYAKGDKRAQNVITRVVELKTQDDLPGSVEQIWAKSINECRSEEKDFIAEFGGLRINLDEDGSLFLLPCNFPGAYNMPYVAISFSISDKKSRAIAFPVIGNRGPTNMDSAYNIEWNDKKSQLSAFFRGRGIGDCGLKQIWQWGDKSYYSEFELLEERRKDDCDGKMDDFPLLWPPD